MSKLQQKHKASGERSVTVSEYAAELPEQLHDLLLPSDPLELEEFSKRIKALRFKMEERAYVMDLQDFYELPLRPNATVKETMIRARLKYRRHRLENDGQFPEPGADENLPVDPLE